MSKNERICKEMDCPYFKKGQFGGNYCAKSGIDGEGFEIPEDCPYKKEHKIIQILEPL